MKRVNPMGLAGQLIGALVGLWVCNIVIDVLTGGDTPLINASDTTDPFYYAYKFLGLESGTTGLLAIAGIFMGLGILSTIVELK